MFIPSIGHFRVPPGLCIKTRLSAQPLIWKWFFILMQIKLIFTRKDVHLVSFWKWGFLELGSGLLYIACFEGVYGRYCKKVKIITLTYNLPMLSSRFKVLHCTLPFEENYDKHTVAGNTVWHFSWKSCIETQPTELISQLSASR